MSQRLEANALECVRGGRTLFQNLSFSLGAGELLEVRGANGSGKTSLLRMLCGLLAPAAGEILWGGKKINALKEEYLKELAYLGHANGVKAELSAAENLRIHYGLAEGRRPDEERISAALERMGLGAGQGLPRDLEATSPAWSISAAPAPAAPPPIARNISVRAAEVLRASNA